MKQEIRLIGTRRRPLMDGKKIRKDSRVAKLMRSLGADGIREDGTIYRVGIDGNDVVLGHRTDQRVKRVKVKKEKRW